MEKGNEWERQEPVAKEKTWQLRVPETTNRESCAGQEFMSSR
jgi:hypothetical protein